MPGYKGHIAGGTAAGVLYVAAAQAIAPAQLSDTAQLMSEWQFIAGLIVIAILFALWPDIDTNSKGQDIFYTIGFVANVWLILNGNIEAAAFLGLLAMIPVLGKHRGWTHSKWAMLAVPLPIVIVPYIYRPELLHVALLLYGAAVAGYFSHLLLDGKITRWVHVRAARTY